MASSNFGGTVVSGIQDLSSLLPLLGTEQCEEHIGSALDKGFLYPAITPISIFGSLGIVRASFNVLVASISIPKYRFLGAKKLDDGGFIPKGDVAKIIAMDPEHRGRFLAESRLDTMLAKDHIENVEDLTVSWDESIFWWNVNLLFSTFLFSGLGILPYVAIILRSQHPDGVPVFPSGWGFPAIRVLGSALCVMVVQFMLQQRVLVILKMRLLYLHLDQLAKKGQQDKKREGVSRTEEEKLIHRGSGRGLAGQLRDEDRGSQGREDNETVQRISQEQTDSTSSGTAAIPSVLVNETYRCLATFVHDNKKLWNPDLTSETCIWELKEWLEHGTLRVSNKRQNDIFKSTMRLVSHEYEKYLGQLNPRAWLWMHLCFASLLIIGTFMIVIGYIGCFNLIQHPMNKDSTNGATGLYLWLGLESTLSVLRIIVWAINPSWDDSKGVIFKLRLSSHPPLITCSKSRTEFEQDGVALATRAEIFLQEVVAYQGLFKFAVWNNIELYYTFMADDRNQDIPHDQLPGVLYVVISNYKEETSRIVYKGEDGKLQIYECALQFDNGTTTVSIKVDFATGRAETNTHSFTSEDEYMEEFEAYYDEIMQRLVAKPNMKFNYSFNRAWAMHDHRNLGAWSRQVIDAVDHHNTMGRSTFLRGAKEKLSDAEAHRFEDAANSLVPTAPSTSEAPPLQLLGTTLPDPKPTNEQYLKLTPASMAYLRQGRLEQQWAELHHRLDVEWSRPYIDNYINQIKSDSALVFSKGEAILGIGWKDVDMRMEANTLEQLFIACHIMMDIFIEVTSIHIDNYIKSCHQSMKDKILKDFRDNGTQRVEKVKIRLEAELSWLLKSQKDLRMKRTLDHWKLHVEYTCQRSQWVEYSFNSAKQYYLDLLAQPLRNEPSNLEEAINRLRHSTLQDISRISKRAVRQRCENLVEQLLSRMQKQSMEFQKLAKHFACCTDNPTSLLDDNQEEMKFWRSESFEQRLRLGFSSSTYHCVQFYFDPFGGTLENLIRGLKESDNEITFVDFEHMESVLKYAGMLAVINSVRSITGAFWREELPPSEHESITAALNSNIELAIQNKGVAYSFHGIQFCDSGPGSIGVVEAESTITVIFYSLADGEDHIICLRHRCYSNADKVIFSLNGNKLEGYIPKTTQDPNQFPPQDIVLPSSLLKRAVASDYADPTTRNEFVITIPYGYYIAKIHSPVIIPILTGKAGGEGVIITPQEGI